MGIARDRGILEVPVSSAARTASGTSGPLPGSYDDAESLRAQLNVTAPVAGTGPTLDVVIEDTLDGTNWNVIGAFAQKTTTGREVINVTTPFADTLRVRWTIGGTTPSIPFEVRWFAQ